MLSHQFRHQMLLVAILLDKSSLLNGKKIFHMMVNMFFVLKLIIFEDIIWESLDVPSRMIT